MFPAGIANSAEFIIFICMTIIIGNAISLLIDFFADKSYELLKTIFVIMKRGKQWFLH